MVEIHAPKHALGGRRDQAGLAPIHNPSLGAVKRARFEADRGRPASDPGSQNRPLLNQNGPTIHNAGLPSAVLMTAFFFSLAEAFRNRKLRQSAGG